MGGAGVYEPPYSAELIKPFCDKYADEVAANDITQGFVLVNNATETSWFRIWHLFLI